MPRSRVKAGPLRAVPDPRKHLSDGVLVEGCLRARLVGIPILKVEATIVLAPAGLTTPIFAPRGLSFRTPAQSSGPASARSRLPGQRLAEAVRRLNEGEELLAEARPNGSWG